MSSNNNSESIEFHCDHLGAEGVSANFTGNWASWGKIDINSVKPTIETVLDAMTRCGLYFTPLTELVGYRNPVNKSAGYLAYKEKKHVYNPAYDYPISEVGAEFNAMGHWETLQGIFGEVLDNGLIPARFIMFERGARMLAQFAFPQSYYVAGREQKAFCSIANALDGRWSVKAGHTLWTPVCSNTFAAGMSELSNQARHTKNMGDKLPTIAKTLGIMREDVNKTLATLDNWAGKTVTGDFLKSFVSAMLPKQAESTSKAVDNRQNELIASIGCTAGELGNGQTVTIYDLFAGTTRYVGARQGKRDDISQYEYVSDGPGGKLAQKAYNWLTDNA